MPDERPDYLLSVTVFGQEHPAANLDDTDLEEPTPEEEMQFSDPLGKFCEGLALQAELKKVGITAHDAEPIEKREDPDYEARSDARLEKAIERIKALFTNNPEECGEAIRVAREMRRDARAEAIVDASEGK